MNDVTKLIEYVFVINDDDNHPFVGLFDVKMITSIVQLDQQHCKLSLKDGQSFILCGLLRSLTNRWIYTLDKKNNFYDDEYSRPSVMIYHKPHNMGIDAAYFDAFQLKQFILALKPELLNTYSHIFQI